MIEKLNKMLEAYFNDNSKGMTMELNEIGAALAQKARSARGKFKTPVIKVKETYAQVTRNGSNDDQQDNGDEITKQDGKKRNKNFAICIYHWKGTCKDQNNCSMIHELPESRPGICFKYKKGTCKNVMNRDFAKLGLKKGTCICAYPHKEENVSSNVATGDNDSPDDTYFEMDHQDSD